MYFPLEKLLDYEGNRYELTKACIEYAKKVRMLGIDEYVRSGEKDALVALKAVLEGEIKFSNSELLADEFGADEDEMFDFLGSEENPLGE